MMHVWFDVLLILLAAGSLLAYSGWGLMIWLVPQKWQSWFYLLVPFGGLFFIDAITHLTLYANVPGYRAIWILLTAATFINVSTLVFKRSLWRWPTRFEATALLCAIPTIILVASPLLSQDELVIAVTSSNADSISHTATTDWLREHSFSDRISQSAEYPVNVPIEGKVKTDVRIGFHFFQMYVDLLTGKQAYSTFSIVVAVSFYLWSTATGFFAGALFRLPKTAVYLSILLFSVSSFPLWIGFGGYGPQILGMGLLIMSIAWWDLALQEFNWRSSVLAAAFSAAFAGIYSDVLPYLIAPVGLFFLFSVIQNRKGTNRVKEIIGTSILVSILTLSFNFFGWYRALSRATGVAANPNAGNVGRMVDVRQVFGLIPFPQDTSTISSLALIIMSAMMFIMFSIMLYGFFQLRRDAKITAVTFIIPHLASLIWFYTNQTPYMYFKGWSIGLFIYIILLSTGIFTLLEKRESHKYITSIFYIVPIFLFLLLFRSSITLTKLVENQLALTPDMVEVDHWLDDIEADEKVYILSGDLSPVSFFWLTYLMADRPIRYDVPIIYTFYQGTPYQLEPWIIRNKQAAPGWDSTLWQEKIIKENGVFILSQLDWRNRVFEMPDVQYDASANAGNLFHLVGYDFEINEEKNRKTLNLTLHWLVNQKTNQNYKLFIHILDQNGNLIQQLDNYPLNSIYHTSFWKPKEFISDSYQLELDSSLLPGQYQLKSGWYLEETGSRLEVEQDGIKTNDSSILLIDFAKIKK